jgi:hypothetical protein
LLLPDGEPPTPQTIVVEFFDLYVRLAAARGDYAEADRLLHDALNYAWPGSNLANKTSVTILVGQVLLDQAMQIGGAPSIPWEFWLRRWRHEALVTGVSAQQRRSEWLMMRAWLALEAGQCVEARQHFQSALEEVVPEERWLLEVRKLNALVDAPNQQSMELRRLENTVMHQRFIRSFAQHHLRWLDEYQRKK